MAYSTNPLLPKARKWALLLVLRDGLTIGTAAQRAGVHRTTLWRWLCRWDELQAEGVHGNSYLPTRSSRPHRSPQQLSPVTVERVRYWREAVGRCAAVVHAYCVREGTRVSLASVKRVLKRLGLTKPESKWKRYRPVVPRPIPAVPGALLQTDVVHFVHPLSKRRVYLYTLIDLHSRWAYAELTDKIDQRASWQFIQRAQLAVPFVFSTIQSDNGGEFGRWFGDTLRAHGMTLRHSRVRKPNDNAFIERFNRTIQDECLGRYIPSSEPQTSVQARLTAYLDYYNNDRYSCRHLLKCCRGFELITCVPSQEEPYKV